ncbi:cell division protein ZapA [Sphingobium phenoxybenzoativorans]|uniref:Cell division protein ZapA n=1 Tax=Sphingobium phenoxybenzoativorans TaxID=1592790 RepID=A0A975K312_9SPHN|nr:cell division protein ZapA [Sphingobium phenoxybenzoativorans]QUT03989.1 cell division protein ZapA [Sphingobium phenoxybenzoativorans]
MADVEIGVGGRRYAMYCRDGDEAHLERLAALVDVKVAQAAKAAPGLTEVRQLLFAAIFLADELEELRRGGSASAAAPAPSSPQSNDEPAARAMESLAERLEALAQRLVPEAAAS